ncbi:hypothetical protein [Actinomyces gaoshouyii]|uniref:GCVT N-terminal domain-containing protein n=1 Tax=Actinomyces gaoshouyii TaxID=1960083 RepID=A0A8H9LFB7_9ACTO|nr:hypothetical protein [Actinomyces gaoshouyii]GGO99238.1 hypothetical protein GCM10011612_16030 [Actinomyces gaoshouyii]
MARAVRTRRTRLHGIHEALGATFTIDNGWEVPLRYAPGDGELEALRGSAGILDLSHLGTFKAQGPVAGASLDAAITGTDSDAPASAGPVSSLPVGRALRARLAVDAAPATIYRLGDEEFLVVTSAADHRSTIGPARGARSRRESIVDATESIALIAVVGPRAEEIMRGVVESGAGMPAALLPEDKARSGEDCGPDVLCGPGLLRRLRHGAAVRATACGHTVILARERMGDADCLAVFCGAEDAVDLWEMIAERASSLASGTGPADATPVLTACGLAAWNALTPVARQ